jgi:8-oxo-dGTP diphosphatase
MHITVVCALIERQDRLLVAKRAPGRSRAGMWEFPGGKIREGEMPEDAIVREIREELGCGIRPIRMLPAHTHDYPDLTVTLLPFLCVLIDNEPSALEHAQLSWAGKNELRDLEWTAADVPILDCYLAGG